MKKILAASLGLLFCVSANSADWTPVFQHLQSEETVDSGKELHMIIENIFIAEPTSVNPINGPVFKKDVLTNIAKRGDFNISQKYKADILPAKLVKAKSNEVEAKIPLRNATLYGYKVNSFTYSWGCPECGDVGFTVNFDPMTDKQFANLKRKINFPIIHQEVCDTGPSAEFVKNKGVVMLSLNLSC